MNILKCFSVLSASLLLLTGCGNASAVNDPLADNSTAASVSSEAPDPALTESFGVPDRSGKDVEIDLTEFSPDMIYAEVYDMVYNSDNYVGKTVRVKGPFAYFQEADGREFFSVLISDATACCSQGIEFVLDGDYSYPEDYPALNTEIIVTGKFNYYKENNYTYVQLTDAEMQVDTTLSW